MIKIIIKWSLYLVSTLVTAQEIKFQNFITNDGLSNNSIADIVNDEDGGLWIGTWDGLNYYDGYEFTVYKHEINNNTSIGGSHIVKLERDKDGYIWIITQDSKVSRYIGNHTFENFHFNIPPKNMELSKDGTIIINTAKENYIFIDNQFKKIKQAEINKEKKTILENILLDSYPNLIINDILKDKSGNIWYATRRNGLYIIPNNTHNINNKQIDHYVHDIYSPFSFGSNEIEKLHEDFFGNIWLGHKDGGLSIAYSGSEQIISITPHPIKFPHLPYETVRAITKDLKGLIWMGYYTKGLFYYSNKTKCFLKFHIKEAKNNPDWERVRSLFTDSNGTIWVGTYAGIIRIKNDRYTLYEAKNTPKLPNNRNYSIHEDDKKQLWIACWSGLAKFNIKKKCFEKFKGQETLSNYYIRNIKSFNNKLIIATEQNGVIIFDILKGTHTKIKITDGILGNSIYSVHRDSETGYYWIASLGGISIYDKEKGLIKNITEKEGLPSHLVYGIIQNNNEIWISTTKGIAIIDKNDFSIFSISAKEGWQVTELSEGAYYQDPKGVLFFGGVNGLNYFSPNTAILNKQTPKLKIIVDGNENYSDTIVKPYFTNNITINLKPILFPNTQQVNIYYKFKGIDSDWKPLNPNKDINYENLPPGNYQLLVKNSYNDIVAQKKLFLKIETPFYKKIWFYALLVLLLFTTYGYIIYLRNKNIRNRNKKLEKQISLRTKEIEHQKEKLITVNNKLDKRNKEITLQKERLLQLHNNLKDGDFEIEKFKTFVFSEFREPISNILKIVQKIGKDSLLQKELLKQSHIILNLISEWNYLDQIKNIGPIKIIAIDLQPILQGGINKIKNTFQSNSINFDCKIDSNIPWVEIDLLRFRLLLNYFFYDIIKYSEKYSNTSVTINFQENKLSFYLKSNSNTLKNNWKSIMNFSPYYKAMNVLLNELNGSLIINSEEPIELLLKINLNSIEKNLNQKETISWHHLKSMDTLKSDKPFVLIFCAKENYMVANQLIGDTNYHLIYEDKVSNLQQVIQQMNISAIIFYEVEYTKDLVLFLSANTKKSGKKNKSIIHITEDINYALQEQSIELGIDMTIQLPASETLIKKKIEALIQKQELKNKDNFKEEIYQIISEDNKVVTLNDKLLQKSLKIIKEELSNPAFNVENLIQQLGITRIKVYRLFKEALKQSPSDVITSLRLQKAEYLLKESKLNVSEVSYECGYKDPKYFGRIFKKHFGFSPKTFKEQNK